MPSTLTERRKSTDHGNNARAILIIDDNETTRDILSTILTDAGYSVDTADDGDVGIKLFLQKQPDLIITDLIMPRMPGIEVIENIKTNFPHTRFIAISGAAGSRQASSERVLSFGIEKILQKPIHRDILLEAVATALKT